MGSELTLESHDNYIDYGYGLGSLLALSIVLLFVRTISTVSMQTSRECPYCISRIPREAQRCAFCAEAVEPLEAYS